MSGTQAPSRVRDIERYWTESPPARSARCEWWVARIANGWQRNGRISSLGYYSSAEYFGVYIWEWINVICPILKEEERK